MKLICYIHRMTLVTTVLCAGHLLADARSASAQSFFEKIGRQLEQEIRNAAEPSRKPDNNIQPPIQGRSNSLPNESGRENNSGGRFRDGGFFIPDQQPRTTQPRQTQPRQTYPRQTQPRQTYPQQTQPRQTNPQPTYPTAPPARTSDVSGLPLKILSPSSMSRNISYWLQTGNSRFDYTIGPGHSQTLVDSRVWLIHFLQSGREIIYRLRGGKVYEFDMDREGRVFLYQIDQQPVDVAPEPPRPPAYRGR